MMKRLSDTARAKHMLAAGTAGLVLLVLLLAVPALAASFTDVYSDTWDDHDYPEAVDALSDIGAITGYSDGTFHPHDVVTRQQFAKMVVITLGLPVTGDEVCPFVDVTAGISPTDPFYPDKYVAVCAAYGITKGKTPTKFGPYSLITRAQVLSMVVRAADDAGIALEAPSEEYYAGTIANSTLRTLKDPVHALNAQTAEMNNLTWGIWPDTATLWDVRLNATRGEVALILWRLWQKLHPSDTTTTTAEPGTTTTTGSTTTTTSTTTTVSSTTTTASTTTTQSTTTTTTPGPTTTTTLPAPNTWWELAPAGAFPVGREAAMAYDPDGKAMIMFGGTRASAGALADTWRYDITANTWTDLQPAGTQPAGRWGSPLVYDTAGDRVILFGGWGTMDTNDTWAYDPSANQWTELHPAGTLPSARHSHALVYDSSRDKVIMFGGYGVGYLNDTWEYDPDADTWTKLDPSSPVPAARIGHTMVYDSARQKVVLFGGQLIGGVNNDTWEYDPVTRTWTRIYPSGAAPSARDGHAMIYDEANHRVVLFGGRGTGFVNDCWAYNPAMQTWTELHPSGTPPAARAGGAAAYDPVGHRLIVFGGSTSSGEYLDDTWELLP